MSSKDAERCVDRRRGLHVKQVHLIVSVALDDDNRVTDASVEQEMSMSPSHFPYGNTWVEDEDRWEIVTGFDASLEAAIAAVNSRLRGLWDPVHSSWSRALGQSPARGPRGPVSPIQVCARVLVRVPGAVVRVAGRGQR